MIFRLLPALATAFFLPPFPAAFAQTARYEYAIVQNGESVGHLKVEETGRNAKIDYYVDSNGRGPKHKEQLTVRSEEHTSELQSQRSRIKISDAGVGLK